MATVTSISPIYGYYKGGDVITFVGTGFQTGVTSITVTFNGIPSTNVVVASDTGMTAVVPALPAPSEFSVVVTTNLGASTPVPFYATSDLVPSGKFSVVDPYLDPDADYVFFGRWQFAQTPIFPSGSTPGDAWLLGGNSPAGPLVFGTLNNNSISFQANSTPYLAFDVATQRMDVTANNFQVASTGFASIAGNTAAIEAVTAVSVGALSTPLVIVGSNNAPTDTVEVQSQVVKLTGIPTATASNVLYYDPVTMEVSHDASGAGGASWLLAGNTGTAGTGKLGTLDTQPFTVVTDNITVATFSATQDISFVPVNFELVAAGVGLVPAPAISVRATTGNIRMQSVAGGFDVSALNDINLFCRSIQMYDPVGVNRPGILLDSVAETLEIQADAAGAVIDIHANDATGVINVNAGGALNLQGPNVNAPGLANLVTPNGVFYDTVNGRLTYGAAGSAFDMTVQVFNVPGAYTYTPTPGMQHAQVFVVGAGGGGGGATGAAPNRCGSGGGAGAYITGVYDAATIGASQSGTVGAGGVGASGVNGTAGGATNFGALITCGGGGPGLNDEGAVGGVGGVASGGNIGGGGVWGEDSFVIPSTPSFGTVYYAGNGASSVMGGGGGGNRSNNAADDANGESAQAYGAGGGGALGIGGAFAGGNGGAGLVYIIEYL